MYVKLYDLEKAKYCLIEFNTFVGELPKGVVIGEVVENYASERLLEDKKQLTEKGYFDFYASNALKIHNVKVALSEYDELKKEKERLERELEMYKSNFEAIEKQLENTINKLGICQTEKALLEQQTKQKIIDYSAQDDIEVLKEVINKLLDNEPNEALKTIMKVI